MESARAPLPLPQLTCDVMPSTDDFRFNAHHLLIDLDATTNHLMMLVVSREVTGCGWDEALIRHKQAYEAWASILPGAQTDPMYVLDARPPGEHSATAK